MKKLAILVIIAMVLLAFTYYLNVTNIESKNRDVSSYHDMSPYIYMFFGVVSLVASWHAFRIHQLAGSIAVVLGVLALCYGAYLASIKTGVLV